MPRSNLSFFASLLGVEGRERAWQPALTPVLALALFLLSFIVFIPFAILILAFDFFVPFEKDFQFLFEHVIFRGECCIAHFRFCGRSNTCSCGIKATILSGLRSLAWRREWTFWNGAAECFVGYEYFPFGTGMTWYPMSDVDKRLTLTVLVASSFNSCVPNNRLTASSAADLPLLANLTFSCTIVAPSGLSTSTCISASEKSVIFSQIHVLPS